MIVKEKDSRNENYKWIEMKSTNPLSKLDSSISTASNSKRQIRYRRSLFITYHSLYNKCVVAKLGAAAASILLQNLELQGFFRKRKRKRQRVRKIMRDRQRKRKRERERERERKIKRDRQTEREKDKKRERER
jgi:hypothetical protein